MQGLGGIFSGEFPFSLLGPDFILLSSGGNKNPVSGLTTVGLGAGINSGYIEELHDRGP